MNEKAWLSVVLVVALGGVALVSSQNRVKPAREALPAHEDESAIEYPNMDVDIAGIAAPVALPADEAELADDDLVVGVSVGDEHRAYRLLGMKAPEVPLYDDSQMQTIGKHVVNDRLGDVALAVTHCDRNNCTQVYERDGEADDVMRIGGWELDKMILLHRDRRFAQGGEAEPLPTVPHVVTTWKEWREKHPDTTVYVGE